MNTENSDYLMLRSNRISSLFTRQYLMAYLGYISRSLRKRR